MIELQSPFKYFPLENGQYQLFHDKEKQQFTLLENNFGWMAYNTCNHWQAKEFALEFSLAKGYCITTGLGLGILQGLLCLKQEVSKVIVYEKSKEIIEIFYKVVEFNNFDISKMIIKNEDADTMINQEADCLFADHFEKEPERSIVEKVKKLSFNNNFRTVWYWPAANHLLRFLTLRNLTLNQESYCLWKNYSDIKNLPNNLNETDFSHINDLRDVYDKNAGFYNGLRSAYKITDQRSKFKKLIQTMNPD